MKKNRLVLAVAFILTVSAYCQPLTGSDPLVLTISKWYSVPTPSGFTFTDYGFIIFRQGDRFATNFDPATKKINGTPYYVDPVNGSDSNSGLDVSHKKKSVSSAMTAINTAGVPAEIYVEPGWYSDNTAFPIKVTTVDVSLMCTNGIAVMSTDTNVTWTLDSGTTWKCTTAGLAPVGALDKTHIDSYGDYIPIFATNSLVNASATSNRCYISGNDLYVNLYDGRTPDDNVRVLWNRVGHQSGAVNTYYKNIQFVGGTSGSFRLQNAAKTCTFDRCKFGYSSAGNGITATRENTGYVFAYQCVASYNYLDGFNYHKQTTTGPKVVEMECSSHFNGILETASKGNNGSTAHDGSCVIRINCTAIQNQNRNFHDISNGTQVWMLGCVAGNPIDQGVATDSVNFDLGIGSDSPAGWYDGCRSLGGALTDFYIWTGSTANIHRTFIAGVLNGTIVAY